MILVYKGNPAINLDNVSNVYFDRNNSKIVFNMNTSCKLNGNYSADYTYWEYVSGEDDVIDRVSDILESEGFIVPNNMYNRFVNPKSVTSFKVDENKLKVIYNLKCTVTHPEDVKKRLPVDRQRLTSDFVFIKFRDEDEFYDYIQKLDEITTRI
jgi:hypothetical protein